MTMHTAVPSDIEPTSFADLADDCREVSGVLSPYVIDLDNIPTPRGALPIEITSSAVDALEGYEAYGS